LTGRETVGFLGKNCAAWSLYFFFLRGISAAFAAAAKGLTV
jgi:hypothetical protein